MDDYLKNVIQADIYQPSSLRERLFLKREDRQIQFHREALIRKHLQGKKMLQIMNMFRWLKRPADVKDFTEKDIEEEE